MLPQTYGAAEGDFTASVVQKQRKTSPNTYGEMLMYPSLNKSPLLVLSAGFYG